VTRILCRRLEADPIYQQVQTKHPHDVVAIYLKLYREDQETGANVILQVRDLQDRVLKASNSIPVNDFTDGTDQFIGWIRFDLQYMFRANNQYRLTLIYDPDNGSTNYPVHWLRDYDHVNDEMRAVPIAYSGGKGYAAPYFFKAIERTNVRKGGYHVT